MITIVHGIVLGVNVWFLSHGMLCIQNNCSEAIDSNILICVRFPAIILLIDHSLRSFHPTLPLFDPK